MPTPSAIKKVLRFLRIMKKKKEYNFLFTVPVLQEDSREVNELLEMYTDLVNLELSVKLKNLPSVPSTKSII